MDSALCKVEKRVWHRSKHTETAIALKIRRLEVVSTSIFRLTADQPYHSLEKP